MVPRDEFHFTFMDDAGLTSRLAEVSGKWPTRRN